MTKREHSSSLEDIKERREIVEYNLSLTNYILETINKVNIRRSEEDKDKKSQSDRIEEDKKKEIVLFKKRIGMILNLENNVNTAEKNTLKTNDDLDTDKVINKYLPLLNKIKLAQEGEIKILGEKISKYFEDEDIDNEESIT